MHPTFKSSTKLNSKIQSDLCKNKSQSSPNYLDHCDQLVNLNQFINNLQPNQLNSNNESNQTNTQNQPYDLRRKLTRSKTKDDFQIDQLEFSSANQINSSPTSPNLNHTSRKKIRKLCLSYSTNKNNLEKKENNDLILRLPDEILLKIFSYLKEQDLVRSSIVCKRFFSISNDNELWKKLYQYHYEYDLPLFREDNSFKFRFLNQTELYSEFINPWKQSFKQFYKSIHIRQDSEINSISNELLKIKLLDNLFTNKDNFKFNKNNLNDEHNLDKVPIIFIHKGTYSQEKIIIENDVCLIGAARGPVENIKKQIIIENNQETTVHFTNDVRNCYLGYVSILFKPKDDLNSICHQYYALKIDGGSSPTISNCFFQSKSENGSTIIVTGQSMNGDHTDPTITNCDIIESNNVGIFVSDHARGIYSNLHIERSKLAGVWVKDADPIFKLCRIFDGADVGVFCFDSSFGYFEECDIYQNRIANFEVKTNANPSVVRCRIFNGQTGGIYIHSNGDGQFLESKIYSNNFAGIWITGKSNPTIRSNEIYDGKQGGIYIFNDGRGLIEKNNIYQNSLAGIQIRNSDPIVRNNRIYKGMHGGVYIHEKSNALIESNEIFENKLASIWITTESMPILRRNRIHSGKQVGVYFYDNGHGILEDNQIWNHLFSGIQIRTGSNPIIRSNKIWGGANGGILVYNNGLGKIENNELFDNAMSAIWIKTGSDAFIKSNKIFDNRDSGICIFNGGSAKIINNDIFRNAQANILISQSDALLKNNRIHNSQAAGIEITGNSTVTLENNLIFNNKFKGLCLATDVEPILKNNKIFDNENLIEKTIEDGFCLYKISNYGTNFPMHHFYRCKTCCTTNRNAICKNCIKNCHKDHDIEYIRYDRFFCDCGSNTLQNQCKLIESNDTRDTLYDSSAPLESHTLMIN